MGKKQKIEFYIQKVKQNLEQGMFDNDKQHDCLEFMWYILLAVEKENS